MPAAEAMPSTVRAGVRKLLSLCNNVVSLFGLFIVALSATTLVAFALLALTSGTANPYLNVIGYLVVPGVFLFGLVIVPIGALWKQYRVHRAQGQPLPRHLHLDLTDRPTLGALLVFMLLTFFVVLPLIVGSNYQAYRYSETTAFCATACHTVMEPQGTAHATSPHARVTCAECHIGEGAGWFVKSKLSGARQVFAVAFDTFSRPIPPAITELRPARDTCEHCHWPDKFHGSKLKEVVHFAPDEQNTRRAVRMLLKIGGADESIGRVEGIHMHMMVAGRIDYVALDEHLQEIPWVRHVTADGAETIYRSDGLAHTAPPPTGIARTIDCMDCHNRGAHHFRPPVSAVDLQLEAGRIDATLPYIKREAVAALVGDYPDVATAEAEIGRRLTAFYEEHYPELLTTRAEAVAQAIAATRDAYRRNFFPAMKVDWRTYPENVGHMFSAGCFRCHDGRHVDAVGRAISSDCITCHTFLNPVPDQPGLLLEGAFQHSMSLEMHQNLRCEQCHLGGPLLLCRDCHSSLRGLDAWYDEGRLRPTH
ncbi:MAG: NapC/NirT family cytochrome c [Phycisphaerales bacterium]|nr:NapC/NirT family cytochrome c [Phycisphaerales bacterium]